MEHRVGVVDRTVAKTYEWLERLCEELETENRQYAYMVLRTALQSLRDRLGPEVSAHVAAQLPLLVRGIFYEGWDPSRTPQKLTLAQFVARVEHDANLKEPAEAERAIRAVMHVLWDELAPGTMDHVIAVLPDEFATVL
ncbi:MAG TPA: DUF2267 domain-containing protein [Acidimicrobiales bacterium]|nr:DUF2267 domain-containing protein [Acidimicrobiales bacterium]